MVRRVIVLLLGLALLGNAAQSVAYAGTPTSAAAMATMSAMPDCMAMTTAHADKSTPHKNKGCTPADCLNFMLACSGLAAMPAADTTPVLFSSVTPYIPSRLAPTALVGQTSPPDIRPPIA